MATHRAVPPYLEQSAFDEQPGKHWSTPELVATHQLANPYWLNNPSTPWPPAQTAFDDEQLLKQ
jgi:hypothetical protein